MFPGAWKGFGVPRSLTRASGIHVLHKMIFHAALSTIKYFVLRLNTCKTSHICHRSPGSTVWRLGCSLTFHCKDNKMQSIHRNCEFETNILNSFRITYIQHTSPHLCSQRTRTAERWQAACCVEKTVLARSLQANKNRSKFRSYNQSTGENEGSMRQGSFKFPFPIRNKTAVYCVHGIKTTG